MHPQLISDIAHAIDWHLAFLRGIGAMPPSEAELQKLINVVIAERSKLYN